MNGGGERAKTQRLDPSTKILSLKTLILSLKTSNLTFSARLCPSSQCFRGIAGRTWFTKNSRWLRVTNPVLNHHLNQEPPFAFLRPLNDADHLEQPLKVQIQLLSGKSAEHQQPVFDSFGCLARPQHVPGERTPQFLRDRHFVNLSANLVKPVDILHQILKGTT